LHINILHGRRFDTDVQRLLIIEENDGK